MDHSENDRRFYVYVHKDSEGVVRYVGSGSGKRFKKKTGRTKEHLLLWDSLFKEILISNLSKMESLAEEEKLINYIGTDNLINKLCTVAKPFPILYSVVSKYLYYDELSPTFLRWKISFSCGRNSYLKDSVVKCTNIKGYNRVSILNRPYFAHRIIWSLCNESDLDWNLVVHHLDSNKTNNCINNLIATTQEMNIRSISRTPNKTTGIEGVKYSDRGYLVFWNENGNTFTKFFSFCRFGFSDEGKEQAFDLAKEYRKLKFERLPESNSRLLEIDSILSEEKVRLDNKTGIEGVRFDIKNNSWVAYITVNKCRTIKRFNPRKLFPAIPIEEANAKAFKLASEYRKQLEIKFTENSA